MHVKFSGSCIKSKKKQVQIIKQSFPLMCSRSLSFRHVASIKIGDSFMFLVPSLKSGVHFTCAHLGLEAENFTGNTWPAAPPGYQNQHLPEALGASSPPVAFSVEAAGYLCPHLGQHLRTVFLKRILFLVV